MAKYYIVDTYTRISLKSSTPKFEANALSTRRNAHAHWYGKAHQILLIIAASIKKAHASVHACALARVFTARTHKECVHTHAHTCMHTCAYILCVYEQWRLWPVCARVHTCMGLLMDAAWAFFMDAARNARMRTLARVFTARTHKECVHICACKYANMCTHSLCVWAVKTLASASTCAHTDQSLHCSYTQRMCAHTCAHLHAYKCIHSLCVWAVKTLASVRTCAHLHGPSLWTLHVPSLWTLRGMHACAHWPESSLLVHTKNVCTFVHASMQKCAHILCVYEQWRVQCEYMCTHWPESSLLVHTKNVCTHMRTLACTHVHTFFVCMSSEDSGQCAHVCTLAWAFFMDAALAFFMDAARYARMRTLARVFTARTQKECVHICACKYANMCTHSLYVWPVKTLASARTCAHTDQSLHCSYTQRMCAHTCAHLHAHMCIHSLFVWAVKTLTSVRTCAHLHGSSLWTLHGPSLWTLRGMLACAHWPESSLLVHTKNVCTFVHASVHKCSHILCVYEQWRLWPVCAHVHTLARVFTARTHKEWI